MTIALEAEDLALAQETLPTPTPDGQTVNLRGNQYGDSVSVLAQGTKHQLTREGSYFVCTTPTPGTAVAYGSGGTQASFSATTAFVVVKNNDSAKRLYLDYIKMLVAGTVPASATSTQYAGKIDNVSRAPSAGASLLVPVNLNLGQTNPNVQIWVPNAAVPTVPAEGGSVRLVERGTARVGISVTLEEYLFVFGANDIAGGVIHSAAGRFVTNLPPVMLNPGEFYVHHLWQPSGATNALSSEIVVTGWTR